MHWEYDRGDDLYMYLYTGSIPGTVNGFFPYFRGLKLPTDSAGLSMDMIVKLNTKSSVNELTSYEKEILTTFKKEVEAAKDHVFYAGENFYVCFVKKVFFE